MAMRNCARPEQVEVTPIYKANQLEQVLGVFLTVIEGFPPDLPSLQKTKYPLPCFHGVSIITSGLDHIAAPTGVPPLANSLSAE
jgi:hypothetical protein